MDFKYQIIVQLIIAIATIATSIISARATVRSEMEKLRFSTQISLGKDFGDMCKEITISLGSSSKGRAKKAVAVLRNQFGGNLGQTLDDLYKSLDYQNPHLTDQLMSKAINEYRSLTYVDKSSKTSKPRKSSK